VLITVLNPKGGAKERNITCPLRELAWWAKKVMGGVWVQNCLKGES